MPGLRREGWREVIYLLAIIVLSGFARLSLRHLALRCEAHQMDRQILRARKGEAWKSPHFGRLVRASSCAKRSRIQRGPTISISSPCCSQNDLNLARSARVISPVYLTSSCGVTGFSPFDLAMLEDGNSATSIDATIATVTCIDKTKTVDTIGTTD